MDHDEAAKSRYGESVRVLDGGGLSADGADSMWHVLLGRLRERELAELVLDLDLPGACRGEPSDISIGLVTSEAPARSVRACVAASWFSVCARRSWLGSSWVRVLPLYALAKRQAPWRRRLCLWTRIRPTEPASRYPSRW